jgi:hypothetical protein
MMNVRMKNMRMKFENYEQGMKNFFFGVHNNLQLFVRVWRKRFNGAHAMSDKDKDIELIERFLKGALSRAELSDFQDRLDSDHEFARKLRLRQSFPSLFHADGPDVIETRNNALKEPEPAKSSRKGWKRIAVTGTIIFIIAVIAGILIYRMRVRPGMPEANTVTVNPPSEDVRPAVEEPVSRAKPTIKSSDTLPQEEMTDQPVVLDVPPDSIVMPGSDDILFRWTMETDSFTKLWIHTVPSGRLILWRGIRPGMREITVPAGKLWNGTYFWYVGDRKYGRTLIIRD